MCLVVLVLLFVNCVDCDIDEDLVVVPKIVIFIAVSNLMDAVVNGFEVDSFGVVEALTDESCFVDKDVILAVVSTVEVEDLYVDVCFVNVDGASVEVGVVNLFVVVDILILDEDIVDVGSGDAVVIADVDFDVPAIENDLVEVDELVDMTILDIFIAVSKLTDEDE